MGRPRDEKTEFKVKIHNNAGYRYASTVTYIKDEKTKKPKQKYVHLGYVDRDLIFYPNAKFLALSKEDKAKFIFPSGWTVNQKNSDLPLPYNTKPSLL